MLYYIDMILFWWCFPALWASILSIDLLCFVWESIHHVQNFFLEESSHPVLGCLYTPNTAKPPCIYLIVHTFILCSKDILHLLSRQGAPCIELSWPPVISCRHLAVTSGFGIPRLFGPAPPLPPSSSSTKITTKYPFSCPRI